VEGDQSAAPASLRELNRTRVVETLRELGVASRAELARRTGLSRSTVSNIVFALRRDGLVVDHQGDPSSPPSAQGGRPPMLISLARSAGVAVGVDFGKRHLAVAVADLAHTILAETWREMPEDYAAAEAFDVAAPMVRNVLERAGIGRECVLGCGMGVPGPVHGLTGELGSSAILPGWAGVRVVDEMSARLALPVQVENDANLGALAEVAWGAGKGCANLAYLKLATGVGAGLIIDGRLFRGTGGTAGEIGHTTLDETGDICRCGNRGCLETLVGAPAIVELLRPSLGTQLSVDAVLERAAAGPPPGPRALADAGRHAGAAVADLCNLFNPERIVVGGTVANAGEVLLEALRESVQRRAIPTAAEDVEIVPAQLGDRAELLGAIALVLQGSSPVAGLRPLAEAAAR
jgi:predicted NBD/HSP70 family sugar kinase